MRIAIVTPVFPPYRGGVGAVAAAQAEAYSEAGHEVMVFSPDYGKDKVRERNSRYRLCLLRPVFKYGNAAFIPQLIWKLHGFDAVILHYPFFGAAELFLLRISKIRPVIFYHMDVRGRGALGAFFRAHQKYIVPLILGRASRVVVTSLDYACFGALKKLIAKRPDNFIEIPLGVDTWRFAPRPRDLELLSKLDIAPQDKILLFVGGLDSAHYFKGVDILLRAFKKFLEKDNYTLNPIPYTLLIVGEGNLKGEYKLMAKESGGRVIFAGSATEADLPKYYNLADLFVLPSIDSSEAFGLVVLEALASGVPVVASNLPGVRTLVDVGATGYLSEPGNSDDLALKLGKYFASENTLNKPEEIARQTGNHYSIARVREEWNKIIL